MCRFQVLGQVVILLASLISASEPRADHELVWKLKPGQELVFTRSFTQTSQGTNLRETRNIHVETIHWRVGRVESDGSARVTQTLDRVQGQRPQFIRGKPTRVEIIDFDSDEVYPAGSPQAQFLDIPRKQIESGEFSFTLTPQGEVLDLVDSEKIKKFRAADEKSAPWFFTENNLRASIPSVLLPKGEVKIGTSWVEKPTFEDFRIPAKVLGTNYRGSGMIEREGHPLDQIEFEVETGDIRNSQSPFPQVIKELRCQGKILFDAASGRMMEWTRETIHDTVTSQTGRTSEQKVRIHEVTTLMPPAEKPAK